MTFKNTELHPTLVNKAPSLAYSLIKNHPFVDGKKRMGHATIEVMLLLNCHEIDTDIEKAYSWYYIL